MMGKLLMRGLLAGAIAALLAFGVARIVGEPSLDLAIAFEEGGAEGAGHSHGEAQGHQHGAPAAAAEAGGISRAVQAGAGLFTGLVVYGAAMGGLFSLAFAVAYGRLGGLGHRGTSLLLAGLAIVVLVLVPALKYPANPPGASQGETIVLRTQWFMVLNGLSLAAAVLALWSQRLLAGRLGAWTAGLAAAIGYAVVIGVVLRALPAIDEVPVAFPATVLWDFRLAAMGTQVVLWVALGVVFGALAERVVAPSRALPGAGQPRAA